MHTIYLIRHGETVAARKGLAAGASDVPLSRLGNEQMDRVAGALKETTLSHVYSSPLRRAAEPAREFAALRKLPHSEIMDFAEIDFGDWEGRAWEEIREKEAARFQMAQSASPLFTFPNGENVDSFRRRVQTAFAMVVQRLRGPAAIYMHQGAIRMIVAGIKGITPAQAQYVMVPNASITILQPRGMGFDVQVQGSIEHLEALSAPAPAPGDDLNPAG